MKICYFKFQALFYIPRYIWKVLEGGYLRNMYEGFKKVAIEETWEDQVKADNKRCEQIKQHFRRYGPSNNWYCFKFFLSNYFLNGFVLVIVWVCTHHLLNYRFYSYGSELISFLTNPEFERAEYLINPMDIVFPKMTKCEYRRIGLTGTNEVHGALCVVLLNILNEKIFFALWILYVALSSILCFSAAARVIFYLYRPLRIRWIMSTANVHKFDAELIDADCSVGDLFMIEQISNVTYSYIFQQFIKKYVEKLRWARGIDVIIDDDEDFKNCRQPWMRKMIAKKVLQIIEKQQDHLRTQYDLIYENDGDFDAQEFYHSDPKLRQVILDKAESIIKRRLVGLER